MATLTAAPASSSPRLVRVFVSSTFLDMHAEREELVKRIFPQLRKLCESRCVTWGEVDLRWGITDEQEAEGKVLPVCLAEIRNCRPYFLGILGERYGWVPDRLPPDVVAREPWLARHVGRSVTELEILHGVLNDPEMQAHAFFYFRDPAFIDSFPTAAQAQYRERPYPEEIQRLGAAEAERLAGERHAKLSALKGRLRRSSFPVRENYLDARDLGRLVLEDLTGVIDRLFPEGSEPGPLDREATAHEAFAQSRRGVHIGRPEYFARLDTHADGEGAPLVVLGDSGAGKSALLATWAHRYAASHRDALVLTHFIGATAESTEWTATLRRLLGELNRCLDLGLDIPTQPDGLRRAFSEGLARAATARRLILVLDGLNQLDEREEALELEWIPRDLPARVRLVLSTLSGRSLDALTRRGWPTLEVAPLEVREREELIGDYLGQFGKKLDVSLAAQLAAAQQCSNPLYLRALLEELRVWGEHETLEARIRHYLGASTPAELHERIFARLEEDYEDERPGLVGDAMTLVWAARRGLSTAELLDLLGDGAGPMPGAHLSPLYLAIEPLLVNRSGLLGFSHEHARGAVEARYLPTPQARREVHLRLTAYFQRQPIGPRLVEELPWQAAEAEQWEGLETLLTFDPFLRAAWKTEQGKLDVRRYWTRLEATGRRIEDAYRTVIEQPGERQFTATIVRELLADAGRVDLGLALDRKLVEFYRGNQFQDMVAEGIAQAHWQGDEKVSEWLAQGQPKVTAAVIADRQEHLAQAHLQQGEFGQALDLLRQTESQWRALADGRHLAKCLSLQADVHLHAGDLKAADRLCLQAEEMLRRLGDADEIADEVAHLQLTRSRLLHARGRMREALDLVLAVERERRARGDRQGLSVALSDLGGIHGDQGDLPRALEAFEAAARIERELGNQRGLAHTLNSRAELLMRRRDWEGALLSLAEAERISRETGDRRTLILCLLNQAKVLSRVPAERPRAQAKCAEAIQLLTELHDHARALEARALLRQIQVGFRQPWHGWVVLLVLGLLGAAAMIAGFRRWWWWLIGGPLVLLWLHNAAAGLIPRYRRALTRRGQQLGAEIRWMDEEERRRRSG